MNKDEACVIDNMLLDTAETGVPSRDSLSMPWSECSISKVIISISPSLVAKTGVITTVDMAKTNRCHIYA